MGVKRVQMESNMIKQGQAGVKQGGTGSNRVIWSQMGSSGLKWGQIGVKLGQSGSKRIILVQKVPKSGGPMIPKSNGPKVPQSQISMVLKSHGCKVSWCLVPMSNGAKV